MTLTKSRVAIVEGQDPDDMIREIFQILNCERIAGSGQRVLLKPNCISSKTPDSGVTTDPRIVSAVIDQLGDSGAEIIIGEGGAGNTSRAFQLIGIDAVAEEKQVELVDLNQDKRVSVEITKGTALKEAGIAKTALKSDVIVNIPKMKVHHLSLVTLCMKNLMGMMLPKSVMHSRINEKIVDLASIFNEKIALNIVDGLVGAEVEEVHGRPIKMNLIIGGRDMVAVDSVAASVMGIDPGEVKYLRLAEQRGLGTSHLSDIEIVGEKIENVRREFERPNGF